MGEFLPLRQNVPDQLHHDAAEVGQAVFADVPIKNGEDEDASESLVMSAAAEAGNMADAGIFEAAPDYGCLPSFKI